MHSREFNGHKKGVLNVTSLQMDEQQNTVDSNAFEMDCGSQQMPDLAGLLCALCFTVILLYQLLYQKYRKAA